MGDARDVVAAEDPTRTFVLAVLASTPLMVTLPVGRSASTIWPPATRKRVTPSLASGLSRSGSALLALS